MRGRLKSWLPCRQLVVSACSLVSDPSFSQLSNYLWIILRMIGAWHQWHRLAFLVRKSVITLSRSWLKRIQCNELTHVIYLDNGRHVHLELWGVLSLWTGLLIRGNLFCTTSSLLVLPWFYIAAVNCKCIRTAETGLISTACVIDWGTLWHYRSQSLIRNQFRQCADWHIVLCWIKYIGGTDEPAGGVFSSIRRAHPQSPRYCLFPSFQLAVNLHTLGIEAF